MYMCVCAVFTKPLQISGKSLRNTPMMINVKNVTVLVLLVVLAEALHA